MEKVVTLIQCNYVYMVWLCLGKEGDKLIPHTAVHSTTKFIIIKLHKNCNNSVLNLTTVHHSKCVIVHYISELMHALIYYFFVAASLKAFHCSIMILGGGLSLFAVEVGVVLVGCDVCGC